MADPLARIAIDTCVIVAVLLKEPDRLDASSWVLDQHGRAHTLIVPAVVLAEVPGNKGIRSTGGTAREKRERTRRLTLALDWVRSNRLQVVEIDEGIARDAAELAATYSLSGIDACVVAAAIATKCEKVLTWDNKLVKSCATLSDVHVTTPSIPAGTQSELSFDQPS